MGFHLRLLGGRLGIQLVGLALEAIVVALDPVACLLDLHKRGGSGAECCPREGSGNVPTLLNFPVVLSQLLAETQGEAKNLVV